jgi:hypothetical protein
VRYRRKTGHRQSLTRLRITDILLDGESSVAAQEQRQAKPVEAAAPVDVIEPVESATTVEAEPLEVAAAPTRRRRAAPATSSPDDQTEKPEA